MSISLQYKFPPIAMHDGVAKQLANISMFTVFLLLKNSYITSKGCVEMDIPWQLCWTIGPLTFYSQETSIGWALALANCNLRLSSGLWSDIFCHGVTISTHPSLVITSHFNTERQKHFNLKLHRGNNVGS